MAQNQYGMQSPNSPAGGPGQLPPAPPQVETVQPTVRVMRLYKPCMHLISTLPSLRSAATTDTEGAGFAVSPYLLLPDSFGEIFVGEVFAAYISVVNGSETVPFNEVTLSVRLQTANASYDLTDIRPVEGITSGYSRLLMPGECVDMVVRHTLSELGTHTLRVSVVYSNSANRGAEPKTLRKFYRFGALQPLAIDSSCSELHDHVMVQCQITNAIKNPIIIEKMSFIPAVKDAVVKYLHSPNPSGRCLDAAVSDTALLSSSDVDCGDDLDPMAMFNVDSLPMLLPNESYAFAVITSRPLPTSNSRVVGSPAVTWRLQMGESGVSRGDDVLLNVYSETGPAKSNSVSDGQQIRVQCVRSPATAKVGEDFKVTLRITNSTAQPTAVKLQSKEVLGSVHGGGGGGGGSSGSGAKPTALMTAITSAAPTSTEDTTLSASTSSSSSAAPFCTVYTGGLCVTGLSCFSVGFLGIGESVDADLSVCSLSGGLQELKGISAVDSITMREYSAGPLFKIFIYDDNCREE